MSWRGAKSVDEMAGALERIAMPWAYFSMPASAWIACQE